MGVAEGMWREIHRGRGPSSETVASLVSDDAPVYSSEQRRELERVLGHELLGAGPLEEFLALDGVTDVLVNGDGSVWIDRGHGLEVCSVDLGDAEDIRRLAVRLAGLAGRRLDDASPYVDAVLPGGVRLHALLPPLVEGAAHISLRVPGRQCLSLHQLQSMGMMSRPVHDVLRAMVHREIAFVISGGTGTGKTTLLGALLALVPHHQRIVLVEDVRELTVDHPHVVRLEARAPNVEGAGEVSLTTLVRQSLRMRPDRVVVGEVRGGEVRELMAALNTGHQGGCGTLHANAPQDVPARFEALGALAGLSPEAVRTQLCSAIQIVIHLERTQLGREVTSIGLLSGDHHGVTVSSAWSNGAPGSQWSRMQELVGASA